MTVKYSSPVLFFNTANVNLMGFHGITVIQQNTETMFKTEQSGV